MKKVLIICAAGMSSSLMAKKTTLYFKEKGKDIEVDAISSNEGNNAIESGDFDLYLISPQTKMYFKQFADTATRTNRKIAQIPPQAYIPIPIGIEKMAKLIEENL